MTLRNNPKLVEHPLIAPSALPSLLYCDRLFYLEQVESADDGALAGVEDTLDDDVEELVAVDAAGPVVGLAGRIRVFCAPDGSLIPFLLKRGGCGRSDRDAPQPREADQIAAGAIALLLEEFSGASIAEARVHYQADDLNLPVVIDEPLRARVRDLIARARSLHAEIHRPRLVDDHRLCTKCPRASICLPEEVRQEADRHHQPRRLFPAEQNRRPLHVLSSPAIVDRHGPRLVVRRIGAREMRHAAETVSAVILHGQVDLTPDAVALCRERNVRLHWMSEAGRHVASDAGDKPASGKTLRQRSALAGEATRLRLASQLLSARFSAQRQLLLDATQIRSAARRRHAIEDHLWSASAAIASVESVSSLPTLREVGERGNEQLFEAVYYLANAASDRHTSRPHLRAVLEFLHSLLQTEIMTHLLNAGLEPSVGLLSEPEHSGYPLALDLLELFRVPLADAVALASFERSMWNDADFALDGAGVCLSDAGKLRAIELLEKRLAETTRHPVLNYELTSARAIELEARLLEKEWSGEPGLFARTRPVAAAA